MALLLDSYSETNSDYNATVNATYPSRGNTFKPSSSGTVDNVKFYLCRSAGATGNIVAKIYAHTGSFGTTGVPTGAALAVSDNVDVTTINVTPDNQLVTFNFSGANRISLTSGTAYCVAIDFGSAAVYIGLDTTTPTHQGNYIYANSSYSWSAVVDYDACFYVYGIANASFAPRLSLLGVGK